MTVELAVGWLWLIAFVMGLIMDVLYVLWFWASETHRAWWGGLMSMVMYGISMFGIVGVVENRALAIPLLLGYGAGSVVGIKWKEWKQNRDAERNPA